MTSAYLGLSISKSITKPSDRGGGLVGARGVITGTAAAARRAETEASRSCGSGVLSVVSRRGCRPVSIGIDIVSTKELQAYSTLL